MSMVERGIDVSSHQLASALKYAELSKTHQYVICRGTYGTRVDSQVFDHIARAKAVGLVCGLYHFFRPKEDVGDQMEAFGEVAERAGMGKGFLVPALDIEQSKYDGPFIPERYVDACHSIAEMMETKWGTPLIYTNPGDWALLGNPTWLKDYLLWLADWSPPADPPNGVSWTLWQHHVGPLPGIYAGDLDQNIAAYLPLIGGVV